MKKYLIFILKCIMATLPFTALIIYTCVCPMGYMDEEYPSWRYTKEVESGKISIGEETSTVILGDSRAMADLVPGLMNDGTVNLGVGGATAIEMYYTLENYIDNNGKPDNVIIMFAPFHYSYMDNYKQRTLYFHHLSLKQAFLLKYLGNYYDADIVSDVGVAEILSMYVRFPDSYLPAIINSKLCGRYNSNVELFNEQVLTRGHALYGKEDGCDALNYEASYTKMKQDGEHRLITRYFDMLLKLCIENDINTIVLQAPMNEASYNELDAKYVSEYKSFMKNFLKEYPQIVIETEIPMMDNSYFGDASHLNEKGAIEYTGEIVDKYKVALW